MVDGRPTYDPEVADRALRVIEGLTFEDVRGTPEEKMAKIYTYAHVGNGHCENPHEEWRKDLEGAEEALVAMGVAVPAPAPTETGKEREG